jgi:S-phase kinase-associated protein 1
MTSLDDDTETTVVLRSKDGRTFELERSWAKVSSLVKRSLETDSSASEVPILGVEGAVLELVVEYLVHHKGTEPDVVEKPLRSKVMREVVKDEWDADFIDRVGANRQALYELIMAANYMDVQGLLHLGCAKVASLIKGQPLEKIKTILDPKATAA